MPKREARSVRVRALSAEEKAVIAAACERFIDETLKPRFLPEVRPTQFNYPVDIFGKWRGNKYSFITRYRSGFPDDLGEEFDSAFTRLDHMEEPSHRNPFRRDVAQAQRAVVAPACRRDLGKGLGAH
jgi:hypothetical protein